MTDTKNPMFNDRRKRADRRQQSLSMPAGLDRRASLRRNQNFQSQSWWLSIDYAVELVSEKTPCEQGLSPSEKPLAATPPATKK